ncbi:MAG: CPBP family intramembrane metalloprotease [Flavobacteriaceae bacterium]|nr:CPBP family intramembrane metalloprotease [Flavobacteriaceae bacterium]
MITIFNEVIQYLKYPVLKKEQNSNFLYRFRKLIDLLALSLITTFTITFITGFLELSGLLDTGKHSLKEIMKKSSTLKVTLLAVVVAPLIEECIFRAPLILFKNPKTFTIVFYSAALLFGYMHIFNYEINTNILLFSPILIAPQIIIGLYLGFIRIRFGLLWSIALHALYNGFLLSLYLLTKNAIT